MTIFDNELMQKIVEETNNYQQQNAAPNVEKTAAWYNTNVEELYIFFATAVLMGLNQKNRIKDYWSTDKLITIPIFGELLQGTGTFLYCDISILLTIIQKKKASSEKFNQSLKI